MPPCPFIAMILDERYFSHPRTYIAGIETRSDGVPAGNAPKLIADIRAYIDRYEPRFLRMLLGDYALMPAESFPQDLRSLLAQPDRGTSVIAKYVYFYYARDHMTFNTVAGEKLKNTEESSRASASARLVRLWNDMVDECYEILRSVPCLDIRPHMGAEIFYKINLFNL